MSSRPVRTCVGCRERAAAADLLRVVAEVRGSHLVVVPDPKRRAVGRGAHLHPSPDCLELAVRRRALARALRLTAGPETDELERYVRQIDTDRD